MWRSINRREAATSDLFFDNIDFWWDQIFSPWTHVNHNQWVIMFKHNITTTAAGRVSQALVDQAKKKSIYFWAESQYSSQVLVWPSASHRKFRENDHHDDSNESSKSINKMNILGTRHLPTCNELWSCCSDQCWITFVMILKLGIFGNFLWVPLDLGQNCLLVILILHKFILVSPKKTQSVQESPTYSTGLKKTHMRFRCR